jgi:hypothetical protein
MFSFCGTIIYLNISVPTTATRVYSQTMPFSLLQSPSPPSELRIDLSVSSLDKPVFTTLDNIAGRVIFTPTKPVTVNEVSIDFVGRATTWVDPVIPNTPRRWGSFEVSVY